MNRNTWSLEYLFQNLIRFWFNLKSEVYYQTQNFQTLSCQFRDYSQPKSGFWGCDYWKGVGVLCDIVGPWDLGTQWQPACFQSSPRLASLGGLCTEAPATEEHFFVQGFYPLSQFI